MQVLQSSFLEGANAEGGGLDGEVYPPPARGGGRGRLHSSTLRSIVQHSTAPAATDATLKPPFWKERALQQQRSKWEQQAEESGAAAPLALLRELL